MQKCNASYNLSANLSSPREESLAQTLNIEVVVTLTLPARLELGKLLKYRLHEADYLEVDSKLLCDILLKSFSRDECEELLKGLQQ